MANNTKYALTKAQALTNAIEFLTENGGDKDTIDRLNVLLTQATAKRAATESHAAKENKQLIPLVVAALKDSDTPMTAKEIFFATDDPRLGSTQKVTAVLRLALKNNAVVKHDPDKKSAPLTYSVA